MLAMLSRSRAIRASGKQSFMRSTPCSRSSITRCACRRAVRLVKKDFWAPGIGPYVGMYFTLDPGPVTLTTLTVDAESRR